MFYQEYQLGDALRPADELDACCRLEGLDPLYIRSVLEKERAQKRAAFLNGIMKTRVKEDGAYATEQLLSKKS